MSTITVVTDRGTEVCCPTCGEKRIEGVKTKRIRVTLRSLRELYEKGLKNEDYEFLDQVVGGAFWGLKKVKRAFEGYIGTEEHPNRINPNPYDTPDYYSMKPSEQGNVESMFMDDVLSGKRKI